MRSFLQRLRTRRLASTFAVLATLSAAILAGSYYAHGVHGQAKHDDSSDATPLKVPNTSVAPNEFAQIAKQVGPAVVNINIRTLPKETAKGRRGAPQFPHGRNVPVPQNPDDDDQPDNPGQDQGPSQGVPQGPGSQGFQDFFNRFFGGQNPDGPDDNGAEHDSLGSGFIVDQIGRAHV